MSDILGQLGVDFEAEYNPKWCKYLFESKLKQGRYDFYIPSMNLIIEMDGGLGHGKDNNRNGQTAEESKHVDNEKDRLANEHGIEVIRIDCDYESVEKRFGYIKENIMKNKKLNILFNLNNIDWLKTEEYSLNNLVKIACNYKRNNPQLYSSDIGSIMGFHKTTISKWLKYGTKLKWCNYDSKQEIKRHSSKLGKSKGKPLIILKDNISQGTFVSARNLEEKSEKLFGIKLFQSGISEACKSKTNYYKGYHFKFISDLTELEKQQYNIV